MWELQKAVFRADGYSFRVKQDFPAKMDNGGMAFNGKPQGHILYRTGENHWSDTEDGVVSGTQIEGGHDDWKRFV